MRVCVNIIFCVYVNIIFCKFACFYCSENFSKQQSTTRMVRKRKFFDLDQITSFCKLGLTWTAIAKHPDISASKDCLRRWREEVEFKEPKQKLPNTQLDTVVAKYSQGQPRRGEVSIAAHIATSGYYVPRQQLRDSIHRVDPEGVEERSRKPIKRKVYYSNGPHHDWHIDGNHKLIRWGMVIHGCIDGCSPTYK